MPGLLDRLLGREPVAAKAVVGAGAYWMEHGIPLRSLSRDPSRRIAEALRLYTANDHVYTCESLVTSKFASVAWHLERDGETLTQDDPSARECYNLLRLGSIDPLRYPPEQNRADRDTLVSRHMGLPGTAFIYLDQVDDRGIPARIWALAPSRLTPAETKRGVLQGWIVDADRRDEAEPIPLTLDEVIRVTLEPDDFGHYGIGHAQAAWRKAGMSNASANFAEGTLVSGGRKAHMIWPDGVTVEGDAWEQWVNGLRSTQDDGSFTRRLTANRFPIGHVETGQTLKELGLPDISAMAQKDIYAIWKMPESQTGRSAPAGLNSGEKGKYEEAALWQNAVEPRLSRYTAALQNRIVDRFGLTLVVEVPEFDDDAPLYEIAAKAKDVPLKVDERRALVGLDPLDETVYGQLGQMVLIASGIVELREKEEVPDNLVPFTGPQRTDDDDEEMPEPGEIAGKARLVFGELRAKIEKSYEPKLRSALAPVLAAQAEQVAGAIRSRGERIAQRPNDTQAWWNEQAEDDRLEAAIAPVVESLILDAGRRLRAGFFASAKADDFIDRVRDYVRLRVGERIRGINATTRKAIRDLIGTGISEGKSPADIATQIDALPAFDAARAELISRTETALAYNDAAIGTYRAFDVEQVQAIDGDEDAECAERNGSIFTLAEAAGITDHPNGTLDWVPIVKAELEPNPVLVAIDAMKAAIERPIPAPVVNNYLPEQKAPQVHMDAPVTNVTVPEREVRVEPAQVTVNVPEQPAPQVTVEVPEAKATLPAEVRVTSMPNRVHKVIRKGKEVVGSLEEDD